MLEKRLVDDPTLPITSYNYSAIRDRLAKHGVIVSSPTVIARAKDLGCYQPHPRKKAHDREVITTAIGALIQHDASHHRWSPYATDRWVLITSLDDFSRELLYAELFEEESTWAHIKAGETLIGTYGIPLSYYVDSLRVFRFVQNRDSFWRKHILQTDEADPQWRQVMNDYRRISLFNHVIEVPKVPLREMVDVHLVPDQSRQTLEIRIWWDNKMVHTLVYPLQEIAGVHF